MVEHYTCVRCKKYGVVLDGLCFECYPEQQRILDVKEEIEFSQKRLTFIQESAQEHRRQKFTQVSHMLLDKTIWEIYKPYHWDYREEVSMTLKASHDLSVMIKEAALGEDDHSWLDIYGIRLFCGSGRISVIGNVDALLEFIAAFNLIVIDNWSADHIIMLLEHAVKFDSFRTRLKAIQEAK